MYSFCIDNKFNIIAIPKNGCTQIIKYISQYLNIFDSHQHSFTTNFCNKHKFIHCCGSALYSYNSELPTYLITRPIELRVLSYFKANYYTHKIINDNPTFEYFVNNLEKYYENDMHHLGMISTKIKDNNIKIDHLLNLQNIEENLTKLFNQYDIKYTFVKKAIINSTTKSPKSPKTYSKNKHELNKVCYKDLIFPVKNSSFITKELVDKIRLFYKSDLKYYTKSVFA